MRRVGGLLPGLRRAVEAVGLLPELAVAERVGGLGVRVAGGDAVAELLAELGEALHELTARDRILDARARPRRAPLAARSARSPFSKRRDAVRIAWSSSVRRREMRPHASPAATRSLRLSSWSFASFFSRRTFVSMSLSMVASCSSRFARSSQRCDFSRRRMSAVRALSSVRSSASSWRHAAMAPSTSRRFPSQSPATSRRRSLRLSAWSGDAGRRADAREEHVAELTVVALRAEVVLGPRERLGVRGIARRGLPCTLQMLRASCPCRRASARRRGRLASSRATSRGRACTGSPLALRACRAWEARSRCGSPAWPGARGSGACGGGRWNAGFVGAFLAPRGLRAEPAALPLVQDRVDAGHARVRCAVTSSRRPSVAGD